MPERYIVAIEIGSSKLRGAIGLADDSGMLDVLAVEEEKLVGSVRYGCINNVEVSNAINCICERLEQYPRIAPRTIKGVYVSVGGRSTASTLIDVEARLGGEQEITREMIADLRRRAAQNIPQERDVIDVAPVKFTVDNKTTVNPVGSYGTTVGARMCVLSCAPVIKRMIRRVIFEKVGLEINGYVARPLAEGALALTDEERRMGAMLVDLGAETTSVTIYKNGAPVYVATLPLGSRNITLDITHALNHIEERAEEIKKVSGNALGAESGRRTGADGIDYSEVNNYVHARAAEIITNILKQIEYAGMRTTDLPGGGSRLRGFNELLTQMSKMKVRMGTTQSAVRISDSAVNAADNIDVISTLVAAAQLPEAECMTEPEPEAEAETGSDEYDDSHDDDDDNVSRIGLEDDDDDDFATGKNKKPRKTSDSEEPSGKSRIFSWLRSRIATAMDEGDDM